MAGVDNLTPITGKDHPNWRPGRGRPTMLNDADKVDQFAKSLTSGATTAELADIFKVSERTVRTYKNDPRIKAAAIKYIEERVLRISRKADAEIENRLANPSELTVDEIIKIRKEFLGGKLRQEVEGRADAETTAALAEAMEEDPELAKELEDFLDRATKE